jgi:hypothetical protein
MPGRYRIIRFQIRQRREFFRSETSDDRALTGQLAGSNVRSGRESAVREDSRMTSKPAVYCPEPFLVGISQRILQMCNCCHDQSRYPQSLRGRRSTPRVRQSRVNRHAPFLGRRGLEHSLSDDHPWLAGLAASVLGQNGARLGSSYTVTGDQIDPAPIPAPQGFGIAV